MEYFKNKVILITGAGGGFGLEFQRYLLDFGAKLILTDISADLLGKKPDSGILGRIESDLSEADGVKELLEQVYRISPVDILINNAGIAHGGQFLNTPETHFRKLMEINIMAPMLLTHSLAKGMVDRKSGHIINISSIAGQIPVPGLASYSTSKFAIRAFGLALAEELAPHKVQVTNAYPFFAATNILKSEQFGFKEQRTVPDFLVDRPADVVFETLQAAKDGKKEVFPGIKSKISAGIQQYFPGIFPAISGGFLNQI